MRQLRFQSMPSPPKPTVCSEHVAKRIAARLVDEINLDCFYWEQSEIADRVFDVQQEIMRAGRPRTVFARLAKAYRKTLIGPNHYGWEGIDEHCRYVADEIMQEEVRDALIEWHKRYGATP